MSKYFMKFEQYAIDGIYGSDILSLANLKGDYDATQVNIKGYTTITIRVELNNDIDVNGTTYFRAGENSIEEILRGRRSLEEDINFYEDATAGRLYKRKTVKYFSQRSYKEIANIYGVLDDIEEKILEENPYISNISETDIRDYIKDNYSNSSEIKRLVLAIEKYRLLRSAYTEFKTKPFNCEEVRYNNQNGRIEYLYYKDQTRISPG